MEQHLGSDGALQSAISSTEEREAFIPRCDRIDRNEVEPVQSFSKFFDGLRFEIEAMVVDVVGEDLLS